ncbi:GABA-gated ion channel [Anopheles sinensis]|uniref:GABA-gated ion channel n=1 Tax=Anopheles sinensis TaxID=74873 RepID=A0A084WJG9_ANOSI|nr:GABA-gated ion channel [Anopheles sinensis]
MRNASTGRWTSTCIAFSSPRAGRTPRSRRLETELATVAHAEKPRSKAELSLDRTGRFSFPLITFFRGEEIRLISERGI